MDLNWMFFHIVEFFLLEIEKIHKHPIFMSIKNRMKFILVVHFLKILDDLYK